MDLLTKERVLTMIIIYYILIYYTVLLILLLFGAYQFSKKQRIERWKFHIISGWVITILSIISAIAIIVFTLLHNYPMIAEAGMRISAFIWLIFSIQVIINAVKKKRIPHRVWAIRMISMMFANFMSVFLLLIINMIYSNMEVILSIVFWLNWLPIIIYVEKIYLKKKN